MMERAQRLKINQAKHEMEKQSFAADMATSGLQQDSIRADIAGKRAQFSETERVTKLRADLRNEYNAVSPKIEASLRDIQNVRDPYEQRRLMGQLTSQAAKFSVDPETKGILDRQFASTMQLVEANEDSKLSEHISTGQFATTEADAKAKFPGQSLRVITRPAQVPGGPSATFFLPTGKADPQLEGQALAMLRFAQMSGDLGQLQEIMKDPAVQAVMRVPGASFSNVYMQAVQQTVELGRKRETEKRAVEDQKNQQAMVDQKKKALSNPTYSGEAFTEVEAAKFREKQAELGSVLEGLDVVTSLGEKYSKMSWSSSPIKKREQQELAKQEIGALVGSLRLSIVGPGAMTDSERTFVEGLIGNPARFFTLNSEEVAKIKSLKASTQRKLDIAAKSAGYGGPAAAKPSAPVSGSRAQQLIRGGP